jgi:hypothetical protein
MNSNKVELILSPFLSIIAIMCRPLHYNII